MPSIAAPDGDIYYEQRGDGPRLLFLNGSGATLVTSAPLIDVFAGAFDLVAYDQRGLGRSAAVTRPYAMADLAADCAVVLDAVGWTTCRVVGVSFGGMVAQELAVTEPGRIERLALLCTSAGGAGGSSYPLHDLASLSPSERAERMPALLDGRFSPEWLANHPVDRAIAEMAADRARAPRTDEQRAGEQTQLAARRHHDVWDRLGAVRCPTFVGCGRHDPIAPVANGEAIASRLADVEVHVYDGGHIFWAQDRAALPEVIGFLRS